MVALQKVGELWLGWGGCLAATPTPSIVYGNVGNFDVSELDLPGSDLEGYYEPLFS